MIKKSKEEIKEFWSRNGNYDQITAHGIHSDNEKQIWKTLFEEYLGSGNSLKILDMGTGSGFLALLLTEMHHDVTGADWSEAMLNKAKSKVKDPSLPVKFVIEDAENLSFPDTLFDAVVSRHMLWTLTNPQKAISEWGRVVKSGGKVIVDVPIGAVGKNHFNEEIGKDMPFYGGTQPEVVSDMLKTAGFTEIKNLKTESQDGKQVIIITGKKE